MINVGIKKEVRLRAREVSDQIQEVEREIAQEIRKKSKHITKALRQERESLWSLEKEMISVIADGFRKEKVLIGSKVRIVVQVGPNGGDILREHIGFITKIHDKYSWKPCFNLSDKNYLDGKDFTIGCSCIQEFETL